jgi:hypothetical protein
MTCLYGGMEHVPTATMFMLTQTFLSKNSVPQYLFLIHVSHFVNLPSSVTSLT